MRSRSHEDSIKPGARVYVRGRLATYSYRHPGSHAAVIRYDGERGQRVVPRENVTVASSFE